MVLVRARDEVRAVERVALGCACAVRRDVCEDVFRQCVGEIHLPGQHRLLVEQHLEMDVRGAAAIPAGENGLERDVAGFTRRLRAAQEFLALGRDPLIVALPVIAGILAGRVAVPDVDTRAGDGLAGGAVRHLDVQLEGDARPAFRDVFAHEVGIEIERAFDHARRHAADVRELRAGGCFAPLWPWSHVRPPMLPRHRLARSRLRGAIRSCLVSWSSLVSHPSPLRLSGLRRQMHQRSTRDRSGALGVDVVTQGAQVCP